jgi:ABC-type nitrate/sulfonate/bicarbonate transport system permease component
MGVSRGLIGLFIGELFTAANGIGYIITLASKTFNSARTYGMLLIFILFCVAMVGLSQLLERKASVWRAQNT